MYFGQTNYDIRLEWGMGALNHLAPSVDAVIIIDVLSFTTCVDVAVSKGASVFPCRHRDQLAIDYARELNAELAQSREAIGCKYSLSPGSLDRLKPGMRLVLPSPNGSTLSMATAGKPTFAACLRNAASVAAHVAAMAKSILVVPAGERWPDETVRFAAEDFVGAGAVIAHLKGSLSPEARLALTAYDAVRHDLPTFLSETASGRELRERRFNDDVSCAAQLNVSLCTPMLRDGAFVDGNNTTNSQN